MLLLFLMGVAIWEYKGKTYLKVYPKNCLATTILKILETNSSFYMKQRTTGKIQFLFFISFLLILAKKIIFGKKAGY